jgi:selenophosphate synthase
VRIGVAAIVLAIGFGLLGHFSETTIRLGGLAIHIDMYGVPHLVDSAPHTE